MSLSTNSFCVGTLIAGLFVFSLKPVFAEEPSRSWVRSSDGNAINASLVSVDDNVAVLKLGNGQPFKIKIVELSLEDQRYLSEWVKTRPGDSKADQRIILPSRINNPRPGDGKKNTVYWSIDGDQGRGYLELTFPNDLFESRLSDAPKVKKLELVMQVSNDGKAGSRDTIQVLNGRKRIATKVGAARGKMFRIEIPALEYENSSKIKMTLKCGTDAVLFEKAKDSIRLEATFE